MHILCMDHRLHYFDVHEQSKKFGDSGFNYLCEILTNIFLCLRFVLNCKERKSAILTFTSVQLGTTEKRKD